MRTRSTSSLFTAALCRPLSWLRLGIVCLLFFLCLGSAWSQSYTASPTSSSSAICPSSNTTASGCSFTFLGSTIKMFATVSGTNINFTILKCDGSSFGSGTLYLKAVNVCGTALSQGTPSGSVHNFSVSNPGIGSHVYVATFTSSNGARYYSNNVTVTGVQVQPNLVCGSPTVTSPLYQGRPATFSYPITNQGNASFNGTLEMWWRGSASGTPLVPGFSGTIAPGQTVTITHNTTSVISTPGSYQLSVEIPNGGTVFCSRSYTVQALPSYTISTSSAPSNGGGTSGGGSYQQGQTATLSASPNSGWTFIGWYQNNSYVSGSSSYSFTVSSNRSLEARFQQNCNTPSAPQVSNPTPTTLDISWQSTGSPTTDYSLQYCPNGSSCQTIPSIFGTSHQLTGLQPNTNYTISIRSECPANSSSWSNTTNGMTSNYSTTVSPTSLSFPSSGGNQTVTITSNTSWAVTNLPSGFTANPMSGTGNGTVTITGASNTSTSPISGSLLIGGISISISQAGAGASTSVNPNALSFPSAGGNQTVIITSNTSWTVTNLPSGFTANPMSGTGNGTVTVTASSNPSANAINTSLLIGGISISISQAGAGASTSVNPNALSFSSAGGNQTVTITSNTSWTVTNLPSGFTANPMSGTGNGTVTVTASSNPSANAINSSFLIGGISISISQAGAGASTSVNPNALSFPSAGGNQTVTITSNTSWTVTNLPSGFTANPMSGTGNGTVTVTASSNPSANAINSSFLIGGISISISQAGAGASTTLSPTSINFPALGGSISVSVSSNTSWTVLNLPNGFTAGPMNGSGNGSVIITASANTSTTPRSGTCTIGGQVLTISQLGSSASIVASPTSLSFAAIGGNQTVAVTSNTSWAVSNLPSGFTASPMNGTGNGTVTITAAQNSTMNNINGSCTIGGVSISLFQSGAAATTSVNPGALTFTASGGTQNLTITSNTSWTVTNVTGGFIVSPLSGSGNAIITVTKSVNNTINVISGGCLISGQNIAFSQQGMNVSVSVSPTTLSLGYMAGSTATFNLTSNVNTTITTSSSWLSISPANAGTGTNIVQVTANSTNPSTSATRQATINVNYSGSVVSTVVVTQAINGGLSSNCFAPRLFVPRNNSQCLAVSTQFEWEAVPNPNATYELEVYQQGVPSPLISRTGLTSTRFQVPSNLNFFTTYNYRVRSAINGALSPWSDTYTFKTYEQPPTSGRGSAQGHFLNSVVFNNSGTESGHPYCLCTGIDTRIKWQCVEFINRFFYLVHGINMRAAGAYGNANSFSQAGADAAGLLFYRNGVATEKPQVGDIISWNGIYGHVAIVSEVVGNRLTVVQQNAGSSVSRNFTLTQDAVGRWTLPAYPTTSDPNRPCLGWTRAPIKVNAPLNVVNTRRPTFNWVSRGGAVTYTIYLQKKDQFGCYQNVAQYNNITGNSYTPQTALTPGGEYLYRIVANLPRNSGTARSLINFFTVSPNALFRNDDESKSISNTDTTASRIVFSVFRQNSTVPVSQANVYAKLQGVWNHLGATNANGILSSSPWPVFHLADSIFVTAQNYEDKYVVLPDSAIRSRRCNIDLIYMGNTSVIENPQVQLFDGFSPIDPLYVTDSIITLHITALNHTGYDLLNHSFEVDTINAWVHYNSSDDLVNNVILKPGLNSFNVRYTNSIDTLYYSKTISYIPSDSASWTCEVLVSGSIDSNNANMYLNGFYLYPLTDQDEYVTLPSFGHRVLTFERLGYEAISYDIENCPDTLSLDWQQVLATSISNAQNNATSFHIFPNPTTSHLTLLLSKQTEGQVEILDLLGQSLHTQTLTSQSMELDLSAYPSGIYLIKLRTADGEATQKVIKVD